MKGLDNILAKITDDAQNKADVIIKVAEERRDEIIEDGKEKGRKKVAQIYRDTRNERNKILARSTSQAKLKARDMIISAKQEKVQELLNEVLKELENLSEEDFISYVKNNLKDVTLSEDDELEVPKRYKEAVKSAGLGVKISDKDVENGFKLHKGNILYNGDFEYVLESSREDLEKYLAEELFKD
ncbi:V-type ATP synthase subunit E [Peptoniphilus sp.]|jgi:V/A-type H+-transporting ATPase subunit E|uniref:V-type ATP synthase subunit E n=1 Tax=Peptoniphilus sp. TaxID=1971214 RepID=UPI003D8C4111